MEEVNEGEEGVVRVHKRKVVCEYVCTIGVGSKPIFA